MRRSMSGSMVPLDRCASRRELFPAVAFMRNKGRRSQRPVRQRGSPAIKAPPHQGPPVRHTSSNSSSM